MKIMVSHKYLTIIILLTFSLSINAYCQNSDNHLIGEYQSINNKFEKWSILILRHDHTFEYKYGLGGCQGNITGKWSVLKNKLHLIDDKKFVTGKMNNNDSTNVSHWKPFYPDLSLTDWKTGKDWIKPKELIDNGCFKEKGKFKKKKTHHNKSS